MTGSIDSIDGLHNYERLRVMMNRVLMALLLPLLAFAAAPPDTERYQQACMNKDGTVLARLLSQDARIRLRLEQLGRRP